MVSEKALSTVRPGSEPGTAWQVICRPAFLPDPNDGSLYTLGGKNNEGLTVSVFSFLVLWRF